MRICVRLQMTRVAQNTHKDQLRSDVLIDADTNHQAWQGNAVRNLLEERSGTSKCGRGQPHPTVAVDDQRERHIHDTDEDAS